MHPVRWRGLQLPDLCSLFCTSGCDGTFKAGIGRTCAPSGSLRVSLALCLFCCADVVNTFALLRHSQSRSLCFLWHTLQVVTADATFMTAHDACNATSPGPGCRCTPEEGMPPGACSAGFICTALWSAGLLQPETAPNATARCWPCSFGQYCPAGSYLSGQSAGLAQAVEKYTCRYQGNTIAFPHYPLAREIHLETHAHDHLQGWPLLSFLRHYAALSTGKFLSKGKVR